MGSIYDDFIDGRVGSYHTSKLRKEMRNERIVKKFFRENGRLPSQVFSLDTLMFLWEVKQKQSFDLTDGDIQRINELEVSISLGHQEGFCGERPL